MYKRFFVLVLFAFYFTSLKAQELPASLRVGSVNVKYDASARAVIEKEIQSLNNNRKYLDALVGKMVLHFPAIERILADAGIPDEIKYLCAQESAFDPDALSTSGAVGFWQFKAKTAKEVGLRVDGTIDERKHLAASTRAAASYLNKSNQSLKNWMSTLLSYRLGVVGAKSHPVLEWKNKKEITVTSDTDWYLLRFLAYRFVLDIEYKKVKQNPYNDILYEHYKTKGKSLFDIASEIGVSTAEISYNNRWLKSNSAPLEKDYVVYMPMNPQQFREVKSKALVPKVEDTRRIQTQDLGFPILVRTTKKVSSKSDPIFYEINGKNGILAVEGDTPESISRRGDISVSKFLRFNDLDPNSRIIPNEVYYLKKKENKGMVAFHTVQGNETLWEISQMYGIQLEALLYKNRISQIQRLQKGRLLWLMEVRPDTPVEVVQSPAEVAKIEQAKRETAKNVIIDAPIRKPVEPVSTRRQPEQRPEVTILDKEKEKEKETQTNSNVSSRVEITTKEPTKETPPPVVASNDKVKVTQAEKVENTPSNNEEPPVPTVSTKELRTHTVGERETYFGISQKYSMKVAELFSLNGIKPGNKLKPGQVLQVYKLVTIASEPKNSNKTKGRVPEKIPEQAKVETTTKMAGAEKTVDENEDKAKVTTKVATETTKNKANTSISGEQKQESDNTDRFKVVTKEETETTKIENSVKNNNATATHTVKAGETLYSIARKRGVSVALLISLNNIKNNRVEIGQVLNLQRALTIVENPTTNSTTPITANDTPAVKQNEATKQNVSVKQNDSVKIETPKYVYHTMKVGETVFRVSQKYGVSVEQLAKWNNLKNFSVSVGQKLIVKK